jgi:hypothetical protein
MLSSRVKRVHRQNEPLNRFRAEALRTDWQMPLGENPSLLLVQHYYRFWSVHSAIRLGFWGRGRRCDVKMLGEFLRTVVALSVRERRTSRFFFIPV